MLFRKCAVLSSALGAIVLSALTAGGCSSGPAQGTQGGPCFPNGSCNTGLTCVANRCGVSEGGTQDVFVPDAKPDTGKDTGIPMDTGPMCPTPGDVTGYTPPAFHDPVTPSSVCSAADTNQYWTDCIDMFDMTKCTAILMGKKACADCLETWDNTKSPWGASYDRGPYIFVNVSGCVKTLGDAACAKALQEAYFCEDYACLDICWEQSMKMQTDVDNVDKCWTKARTTVCKKYVDAAGMACNAMDAASAYAQCEALVPDFKTGFFNMAAMFCMGGG